jgi:hypothetical protein
VNKSKTDSPSAVGLDELDTGVLECLLDAEESRNIASNLAIATFDPLNGSKPDSRDAGKLGLAPTQ